MSKKDELAVKDSMFLNQKLIIQKEKREEFITELSSKADKITSSINKIFSENNPENYPENHCENPENILVNHIIYLADKLKDILIYNDVQSKTLLRKLNLENTPNKIIDIQSIINLCNEKNDNSPYFFPIHPTLQAYKGFLYMYLLEKIHFELTKGTNVNFFGDPYKEIKAYQRERKNPISKDHKNYDFFTILDSFKQKIDSNYYFKVDTKIGSTILKSMSKPHILFYRSLYAEMKSINKDILTDFNERDFLIETFDLFKLLCFEDFEGSSFDYRNKGFKTNPDGTFNTSAVKRFKFQKMRDMMISRSKKQ